MDVTMNDIKKLREMTGAGLADCKKALAEAEDMDGDIGIAAIVRLLRVACL